MIAIFFRPFGVSLQIAIGFMRLKSIKNRFFTLLVLLISHVSFVVNRLTSHSKLDTS